MAAMASQAALVVLAVTIVDVGRELGVSVAVVGQARTVTAVSAIITLVAVGAALDRTGVGWLLRCGAVLAMIGCATSAVAPSLWVFLATHVLTGAAVACLLGAGFAGVAGLASHRRASAMAGWSALRCWPGWSEIRWSAY